MAGGAPILFRMAGARIARNRRSHVRRAEPDLSGIAVSVLPAQRSLQGGGGRGVLRGLPGYGFVRAADNSVWLSLPGWAADYSPAFPPEQHRRGVADPASVLPVGEHPRIVAHRDDPV